jgi:hypothetical protein
MCIHDNFMFVQEVIKKLHKKKKHALFVKLDISKAFDLVNWHYLIQIMTHLGFGQRWRDWISTLWGTTSSSFLLNREPGKRIIHWRWIRQGDSISYAFLLAIEPLHRLFNKAQKLGLLSKIDSSCDSFRISLYANDVALFIKPTKQDLSIAN